MNIPALVNSAAPSGASHGMSPQELKLRKAAAEFEGILLSKWWSAMKESTLGGGDESDPAHDTIDQLGIQSMSQAVASAGGFGIGAMLVNSLLSHVRAEAAQNHVPQQPIGPIP